MKQTIKKAARYFLILTAVLIFNMTVFAAGTTIDGYSFESGPLDFALSAKASENVCKIDFSKINGYKGYKSVKITSSNSKVIKVKKINNKRCKLLLKKTGKATLTFKFYKKGKKKAAKTVKRTYYCYKYENPFSSFKIGNSNITSKFKGRGLDWVTDHSPIVYYSYQGTETGVPSVKLKEGWAFVSATFYGYRGEETDELDSTTVTCKKLSDLNKISMGNVWYDVEIKVKKMAGH